MIVSLNWWGQRCWSWNDSRSFIFKTYSGVEGSCKGLYGELVHDIDLATIEQFLIK